MPKIRYSGHFHTGSKQEHKRSLSEDRLSGFQENMNTVNTTGSPASN